jgi:hypothetical protein
LALTPAGVKAALRAAEALEQDHDAALSHWRLQVERARYEAERAERRYRQVEPEHRLVARGLERDWERALGALAEAEAELELRERQRPRTFATQEREQLLALGSDLGRVWSAPTTTDRDRKQLLRCLIEEVIVDVNRQERRATLTLRWRGGALTELAVPLAKQQPKIRTDEDTIALLERLAATTTTRRSPGSSTAKTDALPPGSGSPSRSSQARAATGASPATSRQPSRPTASAYRSARRPRSSASPPPRCTAGCMPGSSPASRTPPAPPGGSASTTSSARCSSNTRRPAMFRSSTRCESSASAARRCCNL